MKRFIKIVCIVLVLSTLLAVPVSAESEATPYGSRYFIEYSTYLYRVGTNQYEIWFDVVARGIMDELGVCEIVLQRSTDGENWSKVLTYTPEGHPQMICKNTGCHGDCVYYMGSSGWQYRAFVTYYAKNSEGYGKHYVYAYPIN